MKDKSVTLDSIIDEISNRIIDLGVIIASGRQLNSMDVTPYSLAQRELILVKRKLLELKNNEVEK